MTINPGWPVATACILLLVTTMIAYAVGRLPAPGSTAVAAGRAVLQLGLAALVIAAVVKSLALSILLLCLMFS
ncbi:MAG TPA: ABC transporter permease, partial [Phycicoccus sp.]|nr:ABC transporter permease [Phycicoccus sp.]